MRAKLLSLAVALPLVAPVWAATDADVEQLQQQINALQAQLNALESNKTSSTSTPDNDNFVKIGGAVRFNYAYNDGNSQRGGDMKFDTFRLDVNGKYNGILVGSKWRWFEDKALIQTAWAGYNFGEHSQMRVGLDLIPFGNQEYNSHNFDLSPNFSMGLEDNYAFGGRYLYNTEQWDVQLGLFKNRSNRIGGSNKSYSPNLIGYLDGTGARQDAGDVNMGVLRVVRILKPSDALEIKLGGSALYGGVENATSVIAEQQAYAVHSEITYGRWHAQLQATHYEYDFNREAKGLVRGFYGVEITAATRATTYTTNLAYKLPVNWGPIEQLDFYNDYSLVTDKPNNAKDSYDNTLGLGIAAGAVYIFLDWHTQQNMDDMTLASEETSHYFNANFGYYF